MSQFPKDWLQCKDARSCDKSGDEVAKYDDGMRKEYMSRQVPRMAYCKMQHNPGYPTTNPYGAYWLWQWAASGDVYIWGWMTQLPYPYSRYALTINERRWDGRECCSAGRHFQTAGQTHGWNSYNPIHHVGDLWGGYSNGSNTYWHFQSANKPSFASTITQPSIYYKTMTVYEDQDDYGFGGTWDSKEYGSAGPRIACCTITPYKIDWQVQEAEVDTRGGRRLEVDDDGEEVEVYTPQEFRELFGFEP